MDELTVIGVENGALVVVSESGTRFRVPVTEALHTALRQNRPAAPAPHRVGPREVQSLIRQGLTAADVAKQTGEPLEYIQRFEGPVLAERDYVITAARTVAVAVAAETEAAGNGTFGSVIDYRLGELDASDVRWDSRKKDALWIVSVSFTDKDIARTAVWNFDPKRSTLAPSNHEAQSLSQRSEEPAPVLPRLRAVPAEEETSRRFDSGAFAPAIALRVTPSASEGEPPRERAFARTSDDEAAVSEGLGHTADLLEALRRRRGERENAPGGLDTDDLNRAGLNSAGLNSAGLNGGGLDGYPSTGTIRVIDVPLDYPHADTDGSITEGSGTDGTDALETRGWGSAGTDNPADAGENSDTAGKASSRRGRTPMPSWDDIVFGARGDEDPL
jgi:hypothetical protein